MSALRQRYLEIDARTLGWLRIGLGLLLLADLAKRVPDLGVWYVNSGLLPNHRLLWAAPSPYHVSYLFALSTASQVRVAFALTGLIYLCFLLGHRTRLMHVLSWFCLMSLQVRAGPTVNGGDYVFAVLLLWTAFLPLGRRYSLDALRAGPHPQGERPVASLAVTALLLQLIVIYALNAVNKNGQTWIEGSAVHYLLHQARIVTAFGVWARDHLPAVLFRGLSYGTLVVEYALPALILCPWFGAWPRRLAIILIWGFHGSIALLANLGVFSPVMMVFALVLVSPEDHRWLAARPWLARRVGRAREGIVRLLGRVRLREPEPTATLHARSETPLGRRVATCRVRLREGCVALLLVCAFSQMVEENQEVLAPLVHEQPGAIRALVGYLRLNQGWAMFAPDAPRDDMWLVVDATTERGARIDPYNLRASRVANPRLRSVPARLDQSVYFCQYTTAIAGEAHLHDPLRDWIFRHDRRVRRPNERIERFVLYLVEHDSPPPGSREPTNVRASVLLQAEREQ